MAATVSEAGGTAAEPARRAPASPATAVEQAGEQRNARLESLRALAALSVLVSHAFVLALAYKGIGDTYKNRLILNTASLGLYVFFALSGYLLFLPFARHQLGEGRRIDVKRYARNRMLRILPLYFSAITLLLVVHPFDADRGDWWRFALFIQNYSPETLNRLNAPLWTITVEVQYYILLPLLAFVIAKLGGRSIRRTVLVMLGIGLASYALRAQQVLWSGDPNIYGPFGKYALPTLLYAFIGGMLIAVARLAWERRPPDWAARRVVGTASVWIAGGLALHLLLTYDLDLQEPTIALAAFLIVAACVLPLRGGRVVQALQWRPLAMLGVASYSVYVWHGPIVVALSGVGSEASEGVITGDPTDFKTLLAIGLPLCIAAGALSYFVIERPFLRRRKRWGATAAASSEPAADRTASAKG
ncbi:MAG: acyltransferase family protein [Solirubrobacteraceae bacterium]